MKAKSHDFRKQQCLVHKSMSCTCFASEKIPDLMPPISVTLYSGLVTAHLCESSACVGVGGLSVFLVWWTVSRKRKVISFNHLVFERNNLQKYKLLGVGRGDVEASN